MTSFVGVQSDVTERRRISDQLQQSHEKLAALTALRDNLTGMLVHDLRSPLMVVSSCLELLKPAVASNLAPGDQRFVELASRGAATLHEMITSLLDVARLEAGSMPVNLQPADLREIITAATEPFYPLLESRSFTRELPAAPAGVKCDSDLTLRVLTNLVGNALKFTPLRGSIRVVVTQEHEQVKVSVIDSGPGIPAEQQARVFEKFAQVPGHRHRHSSGLGLTFCKLAVEAQGGAIGVESTEGRGTTFWFVLPAARCVVAPEPASLAEAWQAQNTIQNHEMAAALAWEYDRHRALLSPLLRRQIEIGAAVSVSDYDEARRVAHRARGELGRLFAGFDAILTLSAPGPAPLGYANTGEARFNRLWTLMGNPCVNVPAGTSAGGLPVGVQVIAPFGRDEAALAAARFVEQALALPA